ncbi:hypothetical protein [Cognatiyoonia koreensis]|uniref:hypothetical protein n=1 Tax=Cognatiyoonia koreensis TaxID=364200 RepID=UPI0010427820|nr:hypothetical protein [Cognatiyoonia koreensis]
MLRKVLIGILLVCCGLFALFFLFVTLVPLGTWQFDDSERIAAESAFYEELSAHSCLTAADIRSAAAQRDWLVQEHQTFDWCISESGLQDWMSVTIEPAFMMSTEDENRRYFGFDANGCSVDWSYSTCN